MRACDYFFKFIMCIYLYKFGKCYITSENNYFLIPHSVCVLLRTCWDNNWLSNVIAQPLAQLEISYKFRLKLLLNK